MPKKTKTLEEAVEERLLSLLSIVDPRSVVAADRQKGLIYIGGELVDDARLGNLKAEADFFAQSDLWQLMYETPKQLAYNAMFVSGESIKDMEKGRSMLYHLDAQKNILEIFRSYQRNK